LNIEFTSRHFNAPDNLKNYAISEVQKITKLYDRAIQCQILLFHENDQYTTELNLSIPSHKLNVKESTDKYHQINRPCCFKNDYSSKKNKE
jgi:putative sigma-54 modulation protein